MSTNPFTLEAFLAFCEERPPEETYDFLSTRCCPVALYAKTLGIRLYDMIREGDAFGNHIHDLAGGRGSSWTWGALAQRVRARIAGEG